MAYNPHTCDICDHLCHLNKNIDYFSSKYENFIIMGDFDAEITNTYIQEFCSTYNLKSLIKDPTCYKNLLNPSTIDHILTNHPKSFCHSSTIETGLSDFYKLTVTVLKAYFKKQKPKIIKYRNYKNFCNEAFKQ